MSETPRPSVLTPEVLIAQLEGEIALLREVPDNRAFEDGTRLNHELKVERLTEQLESIRALCAALQEARAERDDATGCKREDCPCAFGDRHMWHQAYREKKAELDALKVQLEPKRPHHYDEDGFCACGAVEADESYRDIACTEEPSR